jgi:hypothetical protein
MNETILDACSAFRMMHFNKNDPNILYLDIRNDEQLAKDLLRVPNRKPWQPTKPTIKGDYRKLDYPNESFRLIFFDPSHFTQLGDGIYRVKFGALCAETWQSDLKRAATELWRVLTPYGVLIFKWNDHDIHYKKVLKLFPAKPIAGQITAGVQGRRPNIPAHTFWFTFMKFPTFTS